MNKKEARKSQPLQHLWWSFAYRIRWDRQRREIEVLVSLLSTDILLLRFAFRSVERLSHFFPLMNAAKKTTFWHLKPAAKNGLESILLQSWLAQHKNNINNKNVENRLRHQIKRSIRPDFASLTVVVVSPLSATSFECRASLLRQRHLSLRKPIRGKTRTWRKLNGPTTSERPFKFINRL